MSDCVDGSGPLFAMYLNMADEEDQKMDERWKAEAQCIILFVSVLSALYMPRQPKCRRLVCSLLPLRHCSGCPSPDLQQNSPDISASYLAQIYQLLAYNIPMGLTSPYLLRSAPSSNFSPPGRAFLVNALWFLSLINSVCCSLLATLVQQWAHRYIKVTHGTGYLGELASVRSLLKALTSLAFCSQLNCYPDPYMLPFSTSLLTLVCSCLIRKRRHNDIDQVYECVIPGIL
ncbi:hypothetical protein BJV78DRAFT_624418 [Lactifluus subvellereus]|nr:hypothetical protein BJV78DRAFT_624418 [Lactifluus subvellereus]